MLLSDYLKNVTEFPSRDIGHIYSPESVEELRAILSESNESGVPIHPISTGHNWGLGSKLPVTDANLLSLRKLDQILEVNEELCYARIEPGVTQKQLADYLAEHHPDFVFNITGSDSGSSILANCLERGSGKSGHRADDIRALKVLTPSGDLIETSFGEFTDEQIPTFYKYGLGPDLTHLFTQSNFGIVTEAVINLLPRQPFSLYLIKYDFAKLPGVLKALSEATRLGYISYSLELDSHNDPKIQELFEKENISENTWIGWFHLPGSPALRLVKHQLLMEKLRPYILEAITYASEESHDTAPIPVQVRVARYHGTPSDHSLTATARAFGVMLDEKEIDIDLYTQMPGFKCVLPVIPFGASGASVIGKILDYSASMNLKPAMSIIALNDYSMEVFARVHFPRNNTEQIAVCSAWASGLLAELKKMNIFPYRVDIENMVNYLSQFDTPSSKLKREIKKLVDPCNILSPNRYVL